MRHYIVEAQMQSHRPHYNATLGGWVAYTFNVTHAVKARHRLEAQRLMRQYLKSYVRMTDDEDSKWSLISMGPVRRTSKKGAMEILQDGSRNFFRVIDYERVKPPDQPPWVP